MLHVTLEEISQSFQTYSQEAGAIEAAVKLITHIDASKMNDPAYIASLQQAYQLVTAVRNGGSYSVPGSNPPQTFDFGTYGSNSFFGSQAQAEKVDNDLKTILQAYGNAQIPSPSGGTVTVYDSRTKQPATLFDLISGPANTPPDTFTFKYTGSNSNSLVGCGSSHKNYTQSVNWCQSNDLPSSSGGCSSTDDRSTITKDANGNTIPGGGIHTELTIPGCGNHVTVNCSASAAAIEGYITVSEDPSQAGAASAATSDLDSILDNI